MTEPLGEAPRQLQHRGSIAPPYLLLRAGTTEEAVDPGGIRRFRKQHQDLGIHALDNIVSEHLGTSEVGIAGRRCALQRTGRGRVFEPEMRQPKMMHTAWRCAHPQFLFGEYSGYGPTLQCQRLFKIGGWPQVVSPGPLGLAFGYTFGPCVQEGIEHKIKCWRCGSTGDDGKNQQGRASCAAPQTGEFAKAVH